MPGTMPERCRNDAGTCVFRFRLGIPDSQAGRELDDNPRAARRAIVTWAISRIPANRQIPETRGVAASRIARGIV